MIVVGFLLVASCATEDDSAFLSSQLDRLGNPGAGGILLAIVDPDGSASYASLSGDSTADGLDLEDHFRIGSVTKVFTAALVLSLVDQGRVVLDASASGYVSRLSIPEEVTLRHLLSHRSGLPDYTDQAILGSREEGLSKAWTAEELYEIVADRPLLFDSGESFIYSNTNYLILGVLIEEVTGAAYADALRHQILEPLSLTETYLSYYEQGAVPVQAFTSVGQVPGRVAPVDFEYTSIATSAWATGGLVSTVRDLGTFFQSLASAEIISNALVEEMFRADEYGLGVEVHTESGRVYGHSGGIPGYNTLVMHDTTSSRTAVMFSTNDTISFKTVVPPLTGKLKE